MSTYFPFLKALFWVFGNDEEYLWVLSKKFQHFGESESSKYKALAFYFVWFILRGVVSQHREEDSFIGAGKIEGTRKWMNYDLNEQWMNLWVE